MPRLLSSTENSWSNPSRRHLHLMQSRLSQHHPRSFTKTYTRSSVEDCLITADALTIHDYDAALQLWTAIPEVGVASTSDTRERLALYLERNRGLSTAARASGQLIGTLLCGHDGRRGSLYHLAVAASYRRQGIARRMVLRCLAGLKAEGITSGFVFVATTNPTAATFWRAMGWEHIAHIGYYYAAF